MFCSGVIWAQKPKSATERERESHDQMEAWLIVAYVKGYTSPYSTERESHDQMEAWLGCGVTLVHIIQRESHMIKWRHG